MLLLAVRLFPGVLDKFRYGETTFILEMPVWWGFAAGSVGAWTFVIVSLYTVWRSFNEFIAGGEPEIDLAELGE